MVRGAFDPLKHFGLQLAMRMRSGRVLAGREVFSEPPEVRPARAIPEFLNATPLLIIYRDVSIRLWVNADYFAGTRAFSSSNQFSTTTCSPVSPSDRRPGRP